jgi:hypothetical protein
MSKDYVIYVDTDSTFCPAIPLLDKRFPDWKELPEEEIASMVAEIAEETGNFVNDFYNIFAKKVFNVTDHRLEIKTEIVDKAAFWIKKKRYAQWKTLENGLKPEEGEELDIKGLDVKRSSFPTSFQELMKTVLIMILNDETELNISNVISEFKSGMKNIEPKLIAKNSAVKNMSEYDKGRRETIFSFKKGSPAQVKSALFYNDCLKHFKCPFTYEPMKDGDKIKWVYLKRNPYGIDILGFNGYNDPPEIMNIIETYIDYKKIFEKELEGKLQDFFDALGWASVDSVQSKTEKFFSF